jgi:dynein intermediate chain 2
VTRADGVVDVWDYYHRQNQVAYTHKIGDVPLSCLAIQGGGTQAPGGGGGGGNNNTDGGGRLLAVGDEMGTVALLALCAGLSECQPNEKQAVGLMFEREMKQEKNLEVRERDLRRAKAAESEAAAAGLASGGGGGGGSTFSTSTATVTATAAANKGDEKMDELLRKVDADFLTMIKEAEDEAV